MTNSQTTPSLPVFKPATAEIGLAAEMEMLAATTGDAQPRAFLWQAQEQGLVLPERFARTPLYGPASSASAQAGWPVTTRKTGGGITPQGTGVLNLALSLQTAPGQSRTIHRSYAAICDPLIEAFAALGLTAEATPVTGSFCDGDYNLAIGGRKLVGTAQRWRGNACLCHALILTDVALAPAVEAVARFSAALDHETTFDLDVHCRVVDLLDAPIDVDQALATAIETAITARGYHPYCP